MTNWTKIVVDTNVLTYAFDEASDEREVCLNFLETNAANIVLTHQVLNEYLRVITHRKIKKSISIARAIENVEIFREKFPLTIYPNAITFNKSFDFIRKYNITGNTVFDAYLVATAVTNGITNIATYNTKHFRIFIPEGITLVTI
ncbi:PIN domain-containing protein [Patescibacteria group bacterium]|nr:PIN domain-containing protein [Patescibacteria group bacterium]